MTARQLINRWHARDASFWDRPDTRKRKALHLRAANDTAACSSLILLDVEHSGYDDPPHSLKCKRCLKLEAKSL